MRTALAEYTGQDNVRDASLKTYLPPVGGTTVYFIGDPSKLTDPATEVAVRCHDACCGSDCFGTDICTCRPYLVYAIQGAVETAKRGGVGVIAYFRKEGRALGEVSPSPPLYPPPPCLHQHPAASCCTFPRATFPHARTLSLFPSSPARTHSPSARRSSSSACTTRARRSRAATPPRCTSR